MNVGTKNKSLLLSNGFSIIFLLKMVWDIFYTKPRVPISHNSMFVLSDSCIFQYQSAVLSSVQQDVIPLILYLLQGFQNLSNFPGKIDFLLHPYLSGQSYDFHKSCLESSVTQKNLTIHLLVECRPYLQVLTRSLVSNAVTVMLIKQNV